MRQIRVGKVVLNIGVGQSGAPLERARRVIEDLSGQKPSTTYAKKSIRDFGVHKNEPIGVMATIRGSDTVVTLRRLLSAKEMKVLSKSFDQTGNFSFGIKEHIEIEGVKYSPDIGIWGLDVTTSLERPGYRIGRIKVAKKVGKRQRVSREDAIAFAEKEIGVKVVEDLGQA